MRNLLKNRLFYLAILILLVGGLFSVSLFKTQIVRGAEYAELNRSTSVYTNTTEAARGEIVDRNGVALARNRMCFNVQFNRLYLPADQLNATILAMIEILEQNGDSWNDTLPITLAEPFAFAPYQVPDGEDQPSDEKVEATIAKVKRQNNLNVYATAENVMDKLIDTYDLQEYDRATARKIAGVRYEMVERGYSNGTPYTFAEDVSMTTVTMVQEKNVTYPGVDSVEDTVREYPNGTLAPHLLGYIGPISAEEYTELSQQGYKLNATVGKDGVEKLYESYLKGTPGKTQVSRDKQGNILSVEEVQQPVAGNTIRLTIDARLQATVQELLDAKIKEIAATKGVDKGRDANAGTAVVIDTRTGEILAAVNSPTYDVNTFQKNYTELLEDSRRPLYNRAFKGTYTPGSVFKPAVALAGLSEGTITPSSTVYCGHVYTYYSDYQPQCLGTHGNISLTRALQVSCNIYFYDVARRVGIDPIGKIANQLGLGVKTGVELAESSGQISSPDVKSQLNPTEKWGPGDVIQAGIGQGYTTVTPLQLANYAATIANHGTHYTPHMVKSIERHDGSETVYETPVQSTKVDVSEEDFAAVEAGMVAVAKVGSGRSGFANYTYTVGAKTGTPQVPGGSPNAVFICFGPVGYPEIAVCIIIEHGGDSVYLPTLARDIMNAYFFPPEEESAADGQESAPAADPQQPQG